MAASGRASSLRSARTSRTDGIAHGNVSGRTLRGGRIDPTLGPARPARPTRSRVSGGGTNTAHLEGVTARLLITIVLTLVVAGCSGSDAGPDGAPPTSRDAAAPPITSDGAIAADDAGPIPTRPPFRPELEPNRWQLVRDDLPNIAWEAGLAYDPRAGRVAHHGGHLLSSYAQSNYTSLYTIRDDIFSESLAPLRPMRRCISELAYLDGPERFATVQGGTGHGSLPQGRLSEYRIVRGDARGPWLLDPTRDRWEDARPSGAQWPRRSHANVAYDPTSDVLFGLGSASLTAFVAHTNEILELPLPAALHGRRGYGLAFDPDSRRLVVFGGATRLFFYGRIDGDETDNCDVVDAATCASYFRDFVLSDTWILDIDEAARAGWPAAATADAIPTGWHRALGEPHPPRGMPTWNHTRLQLHFHPPSGRMLLLQSPIDDAPIQSSREWPPIELWALDAARETWERIETIDPPHYAGIATWASGEDALFVWGGGGTTAEARATDPAAMSSRSLYMIRPAIAGAPPLAPAPLSRIAVETVEGGVAVRFAGEPGVEHEIARADVARIAGAYEVVARVRAEGRETTWIDAGAGTASHAYRVRPVGALRWSLPAFDRPARPTGLRAIPRSATEVALAWDRSIDPDVVAYHVYRWGPGEGRHRIAEALSPLAMVDSEIDLSDGLARVYVVTAIDRAGRESGSSPMAFTVPDPPEALEVRMEDDGRFTVAWLPQDAEHQRLAIHYLDYHCNARSTIEVFLDTFVPVAGGPFTGDRVVVEAPPIDPALRERAPLAEPGECGRTRRDGHFFYARVVNALGQPGFYSDIVAPIDERFRAAVAPRL
jgi:hypothetical protein